MILTLDRAPFYSITSGTGVIGYRVAVSLLEAGYKDIRVGIWNGDHQGALDKSFGSNIAELLKAKGAEVIDFDWSKEEDYAPALNGV
jgi:hypothetical protein